MNRRSIRSWALALAAAALAAGPQADAAASGARHTAAGAGALPAALDLSDDALFAGNLDPQLTAQLLDSRFVGVALRAPARVDLDKRNALPVLVVSRFDGERGWTLPFDELAQLVAIEQRTGEMRVQPAFGSDKRSAPAGRGPRPAADDLRQFGAQLTPVDARTRLALPWQPGCWAIRLIYHDWVSNPVHVQLERGQPREAAPCRPASASAPPVDFRFTRGAANGMLRVSGRVTLPAAVLGAERTALAASALVVAPGDAGVVRADWRIPITPVAGAPTVAGVVDHAWAGPIRPGALAYLVVAGQLHGPRRWQAAR